MALELSGHGKKAQRAGAGHQPTYVEMPPMDFLVTREAAKFAAEASIHHLCAVANLIKTCCLEGAAHDLVTS